MRESDPNIKLGCGDEGRLFSIYEYRAYIDRIAAFVRDNPRCRAVALRGCIFWRPAVHVIGIDAVIDLVLEGPSLRRYQYLYVTEDSDRNSRWWSDDTLTDEEENMLCGVYRQYNSE